MIPNPCSPARKANAHVIGRLRSSRNSPERRFRSFQLIAAGTTPRLLGDKARHLRELEDQFEQWTCQAPQARLNAALGLARAMGHQEADLLVLTDEAPLARPAKGIYAGSPSASPALIAFINAARSVHGAEDRVLLEIANPSALTGTNTLRVVAGTNVLHQETLTLATNKTHRLTFPIAAHTPKLQATLGPDALTAIMRYTLCPPPDRACGCGLQLKMRNCTDWWPTARPQPACALSIKIHRSWWYISPTRARR